MLDPIGLSFLIYDSSYHLVLEYTTVHVMYLLLGVVRCSILDAPMDGLRALFLEECQYLRAWFG